jgi:hexosaminidase
MLRLTIAFLILFSSVTGLAAHANHASLSKHDLNLMPWPAHLEMQPGTFRLNEHFSIAVLGHPADRIYGGATRLLRRLGRRTGIFFHQGFVTNKDTNSDAALVIRVHRPGQVKLGEDESYRLRVSPRQIELSAEDDIGALRGLQTVLQLVRSDQSRYYVPDVKINDHPRFSWRGLMIDVARHFEPVNVIERELNGMAAVKLNVLHLHLSDDQGFRIQSKTFPKLASMGSRGKFYTQQQMKQIIKYANDRGIRVVPEFDLPAHSTSWFVGYPQYASAPGPYQLKVKYVHHNAVFDPTKPDTYHFLARFFKEMTSLFPDQYMHIGGDENNGMQWNNNPRIQAFMKAHGIKDTAALQTYFIGKLSKIITQDGKKIVGWDEILQPGVPQSAVIQSWRSKQSLYEAARKGHPTILSKGYYLPRMHSAAYYYKNDPIPPDSDLAPKVKQHILGGEAAMWGEFIKPATIDSRIWPYAAAIAERLWSPDRLQNVHWMYKRLHTVSLRLGALGLTHIKNQTMLLRQLAGRRDIRPLKILVNVIKPVKAYRRIEGDKTYTLLSPFTSIADAATAEAWKARQFNDRVKQFIAHPNPDLERKIRADLTMWKKNAPALKTLIEQSPDLHEVEPLARSLAKLARIGLQALSDYDNKRVSPNRWVDQTTDAFIHTRQPAAATELQIVDAVEKLVQMVEQNTADSNRL